jgi:AraC-like DNA-binding protein
MRDVDNVYNAEVPIIPPEAITGELIRLLREAAMARSTQTNDPWAKIARMATAHAQYNKRPYPCPNCCSLPRLRRGLLPREIQAVKTYIGRNLDKAIQLSDIAAAAKLSPSYFSVLFKQSFGETPHAYVVRCRIARAQHLMLATVEPLSQIAAACGLTDQCHLSKLFRRATGTSPSKWRRKRWRQSGFPQTVKPEPPSRAFRRIQPS